MSALAVLIAFLVGVAVGASIDAWLERVPTEEELWPGSAPTPLPPRATPVIEPTHVEPTTRTPIAQPDPAPAIDYNACPRPIEISMFADLAAVETFRRQAPLLDAHRAKGRAPRPCA